LVTIFATTCFPAPVGDRAAHAAPIPAVKTAGSPRVLIKPLAGEVRDALTDTPIPNATVTLVAANRTVTTNAQGRFEFRGLRLGSDTLRLDARTTTLPGQWPVLAIPITIHIGDNSLPTPLFITELDEEHGTALTPANFDPATGKVLATIVVTSPTAPNATLTIPVNTYLKGAFDPLQLGDVLSLTAMPSAKPPQPLPNRAVPGLLVLAQPGDVQMFSDAAMTLPTKVPVAFPNVQNEYADSSKVQAYSAFGGRYGAPVNGGPMTVQGGLILPDAGSGTGQFACQWVVPNPPVTTTNTGNNPDDLVDPDNTSDLAIGSAADPLSGRLTVEHPLAGHRAMGQPEQLQLVYTSSTAYPHPVITSHTGLSGNDPPPTSLSVDLTVNGTPQNSPVFWQGVSDLTRQAVTFDATNLATGRYTYALDVVNHYKASSMGAFTDRTVLVHNQIASPFGAGWGLADLQRLQLDPDGNALITNGAGRSSFFQFSPSAAPIQDLVVTNGSAGTISLLLGNGDGTFQSPQTIPAGLWPYSVAIGHFNQDTFEDLAVTNYISSGTVSILLGNGDGTFQSPQTFPVGDYPASVVIGHFNQDRFEDLAVTNAFSDTVSILLGKGDGTFQSQVTFSVGAGSQGVAIGHFNADAVEDLAVANWFSNDVSLLLGNGDGTFQSQQTVSVGLSPLSVAIGHFNADAFEDLAVTNYGSGTISLLLGNGDGTFQSPQTFPVEDDLASVAIGHFNQDTFEDLVTTGYRAPWEPTVSILLGNGDGTFQSPQTVPVGGDPLSVAIGHFNPDIFEDMVVVNNRDGDVSILLGNGDGTFQSQQTVSVGLAPYSVAIGNFNNDSLKPGYNPPPGDFSSLVKNADSSFTLTLKDGTKTEFNQQGFETKIIDRNGNTTNYAYNPDGTLKTLTDPAGFAYTFNYTAGKLASITDSAGRTTTVTINASGDLVEILDPDGAKSTFTYDSPQVDGADHLMATRTTPRAYDPSESLPPSQFVTTYTYNFAGELIKTDRPAPGGQTITWGLFPSQANALVDPASGGGTESNPAPPLLAKDVAATLTQPEGTVTTMTTDKFGGISRMTDPLGRVTTIQRDNFGNPTKITKPNGAVTLMSYDLKGNLLTQTEEGANGPGSDDQTTTFTYEPTYNQVTSILDPNGNKNSQGVTTTMTYDAQGNLIQTIDAYDTITEMKYDEPGRGHPTIKGLLTSLIAAKNLPEQNTTVFTYEPTLANKKDTTDPLGRLTSFTYDSAGNLTTSKAEGNDSNPATDELTTFTYDPMNRLKMVLDAENGLTQYTYDANGNLKQVIDAKTPAGIWQFAYDEVDRLNKATDPFGAFETFAYDKDSKLKTLVDRKNQTFTLTYDAVFRLTQKEFPGPPSTPGNTIVTFGYDANNNNNLLDDNDNLASVIRPEATLIMTYDAFDRLSTAATSASPQPAVTLAYTYDKNGNRKTLIATQGSTTVASLAYTLDKLNRLDLFKNVLTNQTIDLTFDKLSRRTQVDFPNSTRTVTGYSPASEITTLTHTYVPTGTLLSQFTYTPDSLGNRATLTETRLSFGITNGLNDFSYDKLNRLRSATHPTISPENYTYDPVGNRDPSTWTYDVGNRLTDDGIYTYTYDANGNQLTKTEKANPSNITTYTYDPENRLISVQHGADSAQYTYDGLDRRIQKDVSGTKTRYIYDHGDILLEYDGTNVLRARWMPGPGTDDPLMMERDTNGNGTFESTERFTYHADALGSITELTDTTGSTVRSYYYDTFGQLANQLGTLPNPYTYTAREYDPETNLLYYRARTYDPRTGRFLQEDPESYPEAILANSEAAMLTQPALGYTYVYAVDNPVNVTDPDGRQVEMNWHWDQMLRDASRIAMMTGRSISAGYQGAWTPSAAAQARQTTTQAASSVSQGSQRTQRSGVLTAKKSRLGQKIKIWVIGLLASFWGENLPDDPNKKRPPTYRGGRPTQYNDPGKDPNKPNL